MGHTLLGIGLSGFGLSIWLVFGENCSRVMPGRLPIELRPVKSTHFGQNFQKNDFLCGDSRDPIHYWVLVEVVLDCPCGWSSGKIVAESCPEGCPLNFGRSKVRTFRVGEFDFDPSGVEKASATKVIETRNAM